MSGHNAENDAGLRERLREALRTHDDGMLDVENGEWVCRCDCHAVLASVDDHEEHRLDALIACIIPPAVRRDRGCAAGVAPSARCTCALPPGGDHA